jgi:hypothetical protein
VGQTPNSVKFQLDERNAEEDKTVCTEITALWGGRKVELRETQRAVTPFGGLVVFFEFLRQVGYVEAVKQSLRCCRFADINKHDVAPDSVRPAVHLVRFCLEKVPQGLRVRFRVWT